MENRVQTILKRTIFVLIFLVVIFFVLYAVDSAVDSNFSFSHKESIIDKNDPDNSVVISEFFNLKNDELDDELDNVFSFLIFLFLVLLIILCLIFCFLKVIKTHIVIDRNEIIVTDKFFKIKLKSRNYPCNMINKFILGMFVNKHNKNKYTVYIDQNNEISEIMTFAAYKEWMKIFALIKEKTNIKIYDGTDKSYRTEDDLFREYFRLKNLLNEIKQDGK